MTEDSSAGKRAVDALLAGARWATSSETDPATGTVARVHGAAEPVHGPATESCRGKELVQLHAQRLRDAHERRNRNVALPRFDRLEVLVVEPRTLRGCLLGQIRFDTERADATPETPQRRGDLGGRACVGAPGSFRRNHRTKGRAAPG